MTTVHRDKQGNVVRTDAGTKPRGQAAAIKPTKPAAAPVEKPVRAAATQADATAPAKTEK
jgi:hypothetical protein